MLVYFCCICSVFVLVVFLFRVCLSFCVKLIVWVVIGGGWSRAGRWFTMVSRWSVVRDGLALVGGSNPSSSTDTLVSWSAGLASADTGMLAC